MKIPSKDNLYLFIGSEFSDRVSQNVKLLLNLAKG